MPRSLRTSTLSPFILQAHKAAPQIPVVREPIDRFRDGDRSLRLEAMAPHPVEQIQATHVKNALDADLYRSQRVYGLQAAWGKRMDMAALSSIRRLPGLPSSFAALDSYTGRDTRIGFEDILGVPDMRPVMPKEGPAELAEKAFRM